MNQVDAKTAVTCTIGCEQSEKSRCNSKPRMDPCPGLMNISHRPSFWLPAGFLIRPAWRN